MPVVACYEWEQEFTDEAGNHCGKSFLFLRKKHAWIAEWSCSNS